MRNNSQDHNIEKKGRQRMKLLDRAFAILHEVGREPTGLGVTEIAVRLGLAKSTTSRLLAALEQQGAVERNANNQFTIGPAISRLAATQPFRRSLSATVFPLLQRLAAETGEAAALCVPEGFQVLYLDQVQSRQAIQVQDWSGARFPMHVLSAGKLFLAYAPSTFVDAYLRQPLVRYTDKTITNAAELRAELARVRAQGYGLTSEEFAADLVALSVPLRDEEERCIAAINIFGPKSRLADTEHQARLIGIMQELSAQISLSSAFP